MKSITIRLNDEDLKMLEDIKRKIDIQYQEIFGSKTTSTTSEVIRSCIRILHDKQVQ